MVGGSGGMVWARVMSRERASVDDSLWILCAGSSGFFIVDARRGDW